MKTESSEAAPDQWVLIRRARQLLTLRGPSGPRRGLDLSEIGLVTEGALLIRNGLIVESGSSRRIENLQQARAAREIDAAGKVVMPAFVDPDVALVTPPANRLTGQPPKVPLAVLSKRRLENAASVTASAFARVGVLTIGAHTIGSKELREATRTLVIHQSIRNKPLRIRSILAPNRATTASELILKWIPAGRKRKLASILELCLSETKELRAAATAGAGAGYSLRIRSDVPLSCAGIELAIEGGAIAILAPPPHDSDCAPRLAANGCVYILTAREALMNDGDLASRTRAMIDAGGAVALASGHGQTGYASFNPQFLLYLASTRYRMTPEEGICAATWNACCSLRMSHVAGSLEPGRSADLLLMDVPDYRELSRRAGHNDVQMVMRAGQPIYRRGAILGLD